MALGWDEAGHAFGLHVAVLELPLVVLFVRLQLTAIRFI